MPTPVARYINPNSAGGDGTSAALTGANAAYISQASFITNLGTYNIQAADEEWDVYCSASGGSAVDATRATYNGAAITTNAATGHWLRIHGENDPLVYDASVYELAVSDAYNGALEIIAMGAIKILGMQCHNIATASANGIFASGVCGEVHLVDDLVVRPSHLASQDSLSHGVYTETTFTGKIYVQNNVISGFYNGIRPKRGSFYITNNTITGNAYGAFGLSYFAAGPDFYFANNLVVNNTTADFSSAFDVNVVHDYNASSDASLVGEANGVPSATITFTSSSNWHITSPDADEIIGAGAGPANATFGTYVAASDPDGNARSGATTDIGADLYLSVGGGGFQPAWAYNRNSKLIGGI